VLNGDFIYLDTKRTPLLQNLTKEVLRSHNNPSLQEALEQCPERLKGRADSDDWIWDLVEWLPQDLLDLDSQLLGVASYKHSRNWKEHRSEIAFDNTYPDCPIDS